MKWILNFLKWKLAAKELTRLYRLESDLRQCRQWLASFDDIALTLDCIASRNDVKGGFDDIRPLAIEDIRLRLQLRCGDHVSKAGNHAD